VSFYVGGTGDTDAYGCLHSTPGGVLPCYGSGNVVARATYLNGMSFPVRKGEYWAVQKYAGTGGVSVFWTPLLESGRLPEDTTPDAFDFTDVTGAALSTVITSNIVTITGINIETPVSVTGVGSPQIRINGGSWVTSGVITKNQTLEVRLTSATTDSTTRSADVTVGTVMESWNVRTIDTTPDAFSFTDVTLAPFNTLTTSNAVTITGIDTATPVSVTGAGSPQIRIDGGSWVTSGTITDGQSLEVRLTSANTSATANTATVTVGSVSDNWSVTTIDITPNAFSFNDVTGVNLNTLTTSNTITISGIDTPTSVSVSGTGSPQISINGGGWTTSGTISNGQSLAVRLTSANAYSSTYSATVTAGGVSDVWYVTTRAALNCTLGGVTVTHGASRTFYAATSHTSCASVSQTRTCNNGTLSGSGSYQYASCATVANCTVAAGTTWVVNGYTCFAPSTISIAHGSTGSATDSTYIITGSATWYCSNGTPTLQTATCSCVYGATKACYGVYQ
jgi:hypothetical protein